MSRTPDRPAIPFKHARRSTGKVQVSAASKDELVPTDARLAAGLSEREEQRVHGPAFGLGEPNAGTQTHSQVFGRGLLLLQRKSLFPHGLTDQEMHTQHNTNTHFL